MLKTFNPTDGKWTEYKGQVFDFLNLTEVEYTAGQRITAPPGKAVYTYHADEGDYLEKGNRLVNRIAIYIGDDRPDEPTGTQWEL